MAFAVTVAEFREAVPVADDSENADELVDRAVKLFDEMIDELVSVGSAETLRDTDDSVTVPLLDDAAIGEEVLLGVSTALLEALLPKPPAVDEVDTLDALPPMPPRTEDVDTLEDPTPVAVDTELSVLVTMVVALKLVDPPTDKLALDVELAPAPTADEIVQEVATPLPSS